VREYEAALPPGGWPNWVLGNHDRSRIASRVGVAQARVAAMLLLTLRGTPTLYYGDELGMRDVSVPPEEVQDPWEKNVPGLGLGRDPERTPMQWSAKPHAGFSTVRPWLRVAPDFHAVNVEHERAEPGSMLTLYRELIALRRRHPALSVGSYGALDFADGVLSYRRDEGEDHVAVLLNLGGEARPLALPPPLQGARPLLSTHPARGLEAWPTEVTLAPDEGVVVAIG
jgi:alpha-glucosidase